MKSLTMGLYCIDNGTENRWNYEIDLLLTITCGQRNSVQAIRNAIRSADFLNIGGNKHRLLVIVVYLAGCVYVQRIGTHAEYSKKKF